LGPTAMFIGASFTHLSPSTSLPGEWLWLIMFCLFPPMTLWLATLNGMIFSVFVATVALLICAYSQLK